ncbi:MAG: DUF4384 domain-containing protein [Prevotella sp.]|nr:DUF4384 domain-containing protein [Prevotella sp.]
MTKKLFVFLLLLTFSCVSFGQKVKTVEGEFTYLMPEDVSLSAAKRHTLQQAKLNAIANEFGTIVAQTNLTRMETNDERSKMRFNSFGSSDVKGEWIETLGKPEYDVQLIDGAQVVTCRVKGKIREIVTSQADVKVKVLRNGREDRNEDDRFKDGDDLFMSFQTPLKGYLAVYLVDDNEQVQCLLPYLNQQSGIFQVEANRRYVLFSAKDDPQLYVDEYTMNAERSEEYYQIYVIFSPNLFVKAVDVASEKVVKGNDIAGYPRELSFEDFHKWLAKCRRHDKDMCLKKIFISVKK